MDANGRRLKRRTHLLRSASEFGAGGVEGERRQGTGVGLDQRHSALKRKANNHAVGTIACRDVTFEDCGKMRTHQVVCIVHCDLAKSGAAWICQERVAVVDGQGAETWEGGSRSSFFFFSPSLIGPKTRVLSFLLQFLVK